MCDRLKEMTQRVNTVMGRNYNTILMNVYKDNKDCFAAHQDNENGWVKGTGFGTLAFGCERPFVIREIATKDRSEGFSKKHLPHSPRCPVRGRLTTASLLTRRAVPTFSSKVKRSSLHF